MNNHKNPFESLEPELEYTEPELINEINAFAYGIDNKTGILPFMNILSLGKIRNDPEGKFLSFPKYEFPNDELFSHDSSSNITMINFIRSFKEYIRNSSDDTLYAQLLPQFYMVCDEALETLGVAKEASNDLDSIIEEYNKQCLRAKNQGPTSQQCLEDIIKLPYSSSLWEISKLLEELEPKKFRKFHQYIDYIGLTDTNQKYKYTTGDMRDDLDTIEFFNKIIKRYKDTIYDTDDESSSLHETVAEVAEVVLTNIEYEFQARTQRIEEELDNLEANIDDPETLEELSINFERWQNNPVDMYST